MYFYDCAVIFPLIHLDVHSEEAWAAHDFAGGGDAVGEENDYVAGAAPGNISCLFLH